jgi:hypothetical protein
MVKLTISYRSEFLFTNNLPNCIDEDMWRILGCGFEKRCQIMQCVMR